jgi:predicted ATPase
LCAEAAACLSPLLSRDPASLQGLEEHSGGSEIGGIEAHRQGASDRARKLLAPVYDRFTEGFASADLIEAKALLEALA